MSEDQIKAVNAARTFLETISLFISLLTKLTQFLMQNTLRIIREADLKIVSNLLHCCKPKKYLTLCVRVCVNVCKVLSSFVEYIISWAFLNITQIKWIRKHQRSIRLYVFILFLCALHHVHFFFLSFLFSLPTGCLLKPTHTCTETLNSENTKIEIFRLLTCFISVLKLVIMVD